MLDILIILITLFSIAIGILIFFKKYLLSLIVALILFLSVMYFGSLYSIKELQDSKTKITINIEYNN